MELALTVVWANVLFMSALAIASSVVAAILALVIDKYRQERKLTNELVEYENEWDEN